MGTLLIGYDLDKPDQDYSDLIAAIKKLGAWWHHLDSTWLVKSDLTPKEARDLFGQAYWGQRRAISPHSDGSHCGLEGVQ